MQRNNACCCPVPSNWCTDHCGGISGFFRYRLYMVRRRRKRRHFSLCTRVPTAVSSPSCNQDSVFRTPTTPRGIKRRLYFRSTQYKIGRSILLKQQTPNKIHTGLGLKQGGHKRGAVPASQTPSASLHPAPGVRCTMYHSKVAYRP